MDTFKQTKRSEKGSVRQSRKTRTRRSSEPPAEAVNLGPAPGTGDHRSEECRLDERRSDEKVPRLLNESTVAVRPGINSSGDRTHYVRRDRSLNVLLASAAPLFVVQAPAGYGKTTLVQQYCALKKDKGARIAWIHFESPLSDPGPILDLLYEELGVKRRKSDRSIRHLAKELEALESGAVIVLDDFDRALSPALRVFLSRMLPLMSKDVVVFIASRALPSLQLPRLRLREKVEILTKEDLRFSLAETQSFFRGLSAIGAEDVHAVHEATDGWPAALQCCLLQFRKGFSQGRAAKALNGVTQEVIDFLAGEVFDELPSELQDKLLDLSVPQRLCSELVEEVLGVGVGEGFRLLDELDQGGLFLSRVPVGDGWYSFHAVFRRFLLDRRHRTRSLKSLRVLQNRVAEWELENGREDRALVHLIDAGNTERATEVFSRIVSDLVAEERLSLVLYCLERLPAESLIDETSIFYAAVVTYSFRREFEKAGALLARRRAKLDEQGGDEKSWGMYKSAQVFLDCAQDRTVSMGLGSQTVQDLLAPEDGFPYAIALNAMAYWLVGRSQFDEAKALLLRARSLHEQSKSLFGQAYQEAISSTALSAKGRIVDAYKSLRSAASELEGSSGGAMAAGSVVDAYLADSLYELNQTDDAAFVVEHSSALLEDQAILDALATKFCVQARLRYEAGDSAAAEETLDRAICLGHRHGLDSLVNIAYAELARMHTLNGELKRATRCLADHDQSLCDNDLLFHSSDCEGRTITRARLLIHLGDTAGARKLLIPAEREATSLGRRRRLLKVKLMCALASREDGETALARRSLIEALEIGEAGGFVRSILDEGPKIMRLLKEVRAELPRLPNQVRSDAVICYIDRLMEAHGHAPMVDLPSGDATLALNLADGLTEKEIVVLNLIAEGLTNLALSARLCISVNTVKWHLRNIYDKLGVNTRMQAVAVARHLCLLD
ncbi:MAG: LuxR C-terminal-related transcriptional regulator [Pseudomonadota bacterium]